MATAVRPRRLHLVLCFLAAGCGGLPHVGPGQPGVDTPAELARRVTDRVAGVETFYERGAGARVNMLPARADVFIAGAMGMLLQIKNPLSGDNVAKLVLNNEEGGFLAANYSKNKAFTGETAAVLAKYLPQTGLAAEDLAPLRLFFPSFSARVGDGAAMVREGGTYVAEFWSPSTGPRLQARVDAWSLAPVAIRIYRDGTPLAELTWSDFVWRDAEKLALALTVRIRLPGQGKTITFGLEKPTINGRIGEEAFSLLPPPGLEEEAVGAGGAP